MPFIFPIKGYLEKSYLSASKTSYPEVSLISYSKPCISMRTYKDYLVYLSNSHNINTDTCDKKHFNNLCNNLKELKLSPDYLWSNIDIMTNDGLPYVGEIKDKMLIATGYNTWGLASSVLSGKILLDIIDNKDNKYHKLFNPKRVNIGQILGSMSSIYKNMSGFIQGMKLQENVQSSGNKLSYNGYTVLKKCPHLGCHLLFNEVEETWDCPCHGSRFDIDGNCLSAPANKSIKLKK